MTRAERQLIELYLPLSIMQARGKKALQMFASLIGRSGFIFGGKPLNGKETSLWVRWVEEVFIPMNSEMISLLNSKTDLIETPVPRSFYSLIDHNYYLKRELQRWKDEGVEWRHPGNFPVDIEKDIMNEIGRLSVEIGWLEKLPK
jgi:hypothetical protein